MELFRKAAEILMVIEDGVNLNQIERSLEYSYAWIFKMVNLFEKEGIVTTEKCGRNRLIYLTKKGKDIKSEIKKIKELI